MNRRNTVPTVLLGIAWVAPFSAWSDTLLENASVRVKGDQEIFVNEEKQRMSVEGSVRPQDILTDNTVLSTRLGQAKIEMIGQGLLAEKQKPGILTRFLSWLGIL